MRLSLYGHAKDPEPKPRDLAWSELARTLGPHITTYPSKHRTPCFSPAVYPEGTTARTKGAVESVSFGVLDLDHLSQAQITEVLAAARDLSCIFYTSWSHDPAPAPHEWRARLLIELSRPVLINEWPTFWRVMNEVLGGHGDTQCSDASRIYFAPACPPERAAHAIYDTQEGVPFDVDAALLSAPAPAPATLAPIASAPAALSTNPHEIIPAPLVKRAAAKLQRSSDPYTQYLGRAIEHGLEGRPFAVSGGRDDAVFKVAGILASTFPQADPEALADLFRVSLLSMGEDGPQAHDMAAKIARHQQDIEHETRAEETQSTRTNALRISQAIPGRTHPYTPEELQAWAPESSKHLWILQHKRDYYFLVQGSYLGPYVPESAPAVALTCLAPATTAGIELYKRNKEGQVVQRPIGELMRDYGTVLDDVVLSYLETTARYESLDGRRRLCLPCSPQRDLEPLYDPEIDLWLKHLAGPDYELLQDWLALVPDLSRPLKALYVSGVPGAGKTLLAEGLARLWGTKGSANVHEVFSNFNDALLSSPLILADESIPQDYRGSARTEALREIIQSRRRQINRKHISPVHLEGATRMVITSNNMDLLNGMRSSLTHNDLYAIEERLFLIQAPKQAQTYLRGLTPRKVKSWVKGDLLARHCLHLARTRTPPEGHRFGIPSPKDNALVKHLVTGAGARSDVCHWCVEYLLSPARVDAAQDGLIRIEAGALWITTRGLHQHWDKYRVSREVPHTSQLNRALTTLKMPETRRLSLPDGRRVRFYQIKLSFLVNWAEQSGFASEEDLEKALAGTR